MPLFRLSQRNAERETKKGAPLKSRNSEPSFLPTPILRDLGGDFDFAIAIKRPSQTILLLGKGEDGGKAQLPQAAAKAGFMHNREGHEFHSCHLRP
jgi:hypothetical protein